MGGQCIIRIVTPNGEPVPGATAAIVRASRAMPEVGFRASEDGRLVLALPPGPAVIAVFGPENTHRDVHVDVPADGTVSATVVLPAAQRLNLRR